MIKAVLFDMDGVLVDSEKWICKAAIQMFQELGLDVEEDDFLPFVGTGENRYIGGVADKYDFEIDIEACKERTYKIYLEIIQNNLDPLPGVNQFIHKCRALGLKIAVATSADEIKMKANLHEIGLPESVFDATVNGLMVEKKKPFPDIYLLAASLLNVNPEECLVVEDAVNGVEAAKYAKAKCLALTTSFPKEMLKEADWFAKTLEDAPKECLLW